MATSPATILYLVDTSAWIFSLRRNPNRAIASRLDELLGLDAIATCGMIELELLGGAASPAELEHLRLRLQGLHRLITEEPDWNNAARLAFDLRRNGITVPFTDALLAALAIRHHATLLHADRDFEAIAANANLQTESHLAQIRPESTSPPG